MAVGTPWRQVPTAVSRGGRIALPAAGPRDTALGPCRPVPRLQVPTAVPRDVRSLFIFLVSFLKHFKPF
jgi:hypothetical protein